MSPPLMILLSATLILRSRLFSVPKDVLDATVDAMARRISRRGRHEPQEWAKLLEQVYRKRDDGGKILLVPVHDSYVKEVSSSSDF